jgi:hypothetical protein
VSVAEFEYRFVEYIPPDPQEAVVYVSTAYATVVHLCACGCGTKVVTPLGPAEWSLTFDGESISLNPSIGNWEFPCRSHYWISHNKVRWAASFSRKTAAAAGWRDETDLEAHFASRDKRTPPEQPNPVITASRRGVLRRAWSKLIKRS